MLSGGFGEVLRIGCSFVCSQMCVKAVADFFLFDMDGRQHNVTGRLFAQLHDPLAQIRINDSNAAIFQIRVQVTLFSQH